MDVVHLRCFTVEQVFHHVNLIPVMVDGHNVFVKTVFHFGNPVLLLFFSRKPDILEMLHGIEINVSEQSVGRKFDFFGSHVERFEETVQFIMQFSFF